ncbi:MAG: polyribonucleotide nucleotidyltransferase [Planctomycetes bacterium]|nr:polyribonucleotide nucleotidyltransferase [Planctomycetota bacterium]
MQPTAHTTTVKIAGTEVSFETGRIARQATGAVLARCGDNVVLATVTAAAAPKPGQDFFPLTVEYREKFAGAGRIPGAFGKREGRITDHEVLVCRLIDRSVRSLFPKHYKNEVQLQVQVLSCEPTSDLESLAILAACCAVHISPVPCNGPIAGLRVWRVEDSWQAFVGRDKAQDADLEFSVAVGPEGLVMLEGEAKEASEADAVAAIRQATEWIERCHKAFDELAAKTGRVKQPAPDAPELPKLPADADAALKAALKIQSKPERRAAISAAESAWLETLAEEARPCAKQAFGDAVWEQMRENVLATGARLDGRGETDIRPIWSEVGLLPRAHGSALFTRGETQAIVTCTLGSPDDALRQGNLADETDRKSFFLHYNFPPYSVGETRPLRGPGRREIGHGSLARRGLQPLMPTQTRFPFTVRVESEITESNGSSSMATVCGGSMAMMHAGVPIDRPLAGIAMGLISDGARHAVLSDIIGDEDHLGDMDFKVVGTERGITAIQLDNKLGGLPDEVLAKALEQARDGRLHILAEMAKTIAAPGEPSRHVPQAFHISIMPDAVGALIGPRGANIKGITEATGAKVSVNDEGGVLIYATDATSATRAREMVQRSAGVLHVGKCYRGTVTGVKDFGAFVRINAVNEGLVPIEELDKDRVQRAADVAKEGDEMIVAVIGADDRGRLRLSRRQALGVTDAQIEF